MTTSSQGSSLMVNVRVRQTPVSVLIPTKNEQRHIVDCIRSVSWADEIIVVDSLSSDGTQLLAEQEGAKVVQFNYRPGGPKKKNWALANLPFRNEWIFIIDADERATDELAQEIDRVVTGDCSERGWLINRRFYFLGKWIRHAGYYPSWNLRLIKRGYGKYESIIDFDSASGDNEVHEHIEVIGRSGFLCSPMEHYAFPSVDIFVEKHNRYSNWEARLESRSKRGSSPAAQAGGALAGGVRIKRGLKTVARRLPFPHWARFAYHYVFRGGFMDGSVGYMFCHLLAEYEFLIWAKSKELRCVEELQSSK